MRDLGELDYVKLYAEKLKADNSLFVQQKLLIDSQILASRSLFSKILAFPGYKKQARRYLKGVGML